MPPLLGVVAALLLFLLARRGLIDDAYITLDYARTVAFHGQWALEPGHVANTATSPFNVLLLALFSVIFRDPMVAVALVLMLSLGLVGAAASGIAGRLGWSRWPAGLGVLGVAVSPLLASTVGMETYLAVGLVAALGWTAVAGRPVLAGVVVGLLALTRPDLVVFGLTVLLVPRLLRRLHLVVLAAIVTAGPWFVLSWFLLGSALPDTMLLKVGDHWGPWSFGNGLMLYHLAYPAAIWWTVVPAAVGVLAAVGLLVARLAGVRGGSLLAVVWGIGAALHAGLYLAIGTAPYHWYYGPALGALTLLAYMSLGALPRVPRRLGLVVAAAAVVGAGGFLATRSWDMAPITTNWATSAQYEAAAALAPPGAVVRSPGEIGTLAYYCDCTVVDTFSDRAVIADLLDQREAASGALFRRLLELNYHNLHTEAPIEAQWRFVQGPEGQGVRTSSPWIPPGVLGIEPLPPA